MPFPFPDLFNEGEATKLDFSPVSLATLTGRTIRKVNHPNCVNETLPYTGDLKLSERDNNCSGSTKCSKNDSTYYSSLINWPQSVLGSGSLSLWPIGLSLSLLQDGGGVHTCGLNCLNIVGNAAEHSSRSTTSLPIYTASCCPRWRSG